MSSTTKYGDEFSTSTLDYSDFPSLCDKSEVQKIISMLQLCIYSVVFILGLLGNGLVLATYIRHKHRMAMSDVYLLNLAIADLLFLFNLPFLAASSQVGWIFGGFLCVLVQMLYKVNLYSGFLLLMCVSVDRYFAIVCATTTHRLRSRHLQYSRHICLLVWLSSLLLSLPEVIYTKVEHHSTSMCLVIFPESLSSWMRVATPMVQMLLGFLLPLLVMTFCYSIIIKTLLQARNFEKHKAIRVILVVVLIFVIFQAPYNIFLLLTTVKTLGSGGMVCEESKRRDVVLQVTSCLAYTRCCLNPILYAFVGVKFRNNLLKLIRCLGCPLQRLDMVAVRRPSRVFTLITDTSSTVTV
ncbi:C-C chemokine receptor type 7-like [Pristis pectinata]|uniref:C-C chemokine receptor type 7-like n=1 Tax=Pristis pectinata TaxID=685728 RepID=UPI00223D3EE1|nr:C-C chemokine receptor type 7-like [Pristis pectinata]